MLIFDYIKSSLNNHSVQEFQQVDLRSKMELIQDISTLAADNILNDVKLQSNPHVMRGLQGSIPGCQMSIEMTDAGGRKVSMSILAQARNKLKGQKKGCRKDPPQIPSLRNHTPPASIFLGGRKVSIYVHCTGKEQAQGAEEGEQEGSTIDSVSRGPHTSCLYLPQQCWESRSS